MPPHILLINCDDLGYGDLSCYGSPVNRTPSVDRLAEEGLRLTDFYVASPVCSPSRAALMTGSLPPRVGFGEFDGEGVLFPGMPYGLAPGEQTIATMLKDAGYATAMIGKWHCGDQPEFLPTQHGFDSWFGLPYSNDMGRQRRPDGSVTSGPPLPLMHNDTVLEEQPLMAALTERYTAEAVRLLRTHTPDQPLFLYLAHLHPHLPHITPETFTETSTNGVYGAAVEYVDWSTGVILDELDRLGIADDTIVIFTSDNGSRVAGEGGRNDPLRGTKRTNFDGGVRVPCLVRWPGRIPAGSTSRSVTSAMDLLPTLATIAEGTLRDDRVRDGFDISSVWLHPDTASSEREVLPYYWKNNLEAVRRGRWKLHVFRHEPADGDLLELYDLESDIGETTDVAAENPAVVTELLAVVEDVRRRCGDERTGHPGQDRRPIGKVDDPDTLTHFDPDRRYLTALYDGPTG